MNPKRSLLRLVGVGTLLLCTLPAAATEDIRFSYSYVELAGDLSRTHNTARGAVGDSPGRMLSIGAAREVNDRVYFHGKLSTEDKDLQNDVFGFGGTTDLDTTQQVAALGIGLRAPVTTATDAFAEAAAMHSTLDHRIPCVTDTAGTCHSIRTSRGRQITAAYFASLRAYVPGSGPPPAPPAVRSIDRKLDDTGLGFRIGARHRLSASSEVHAGLAFHRILEQNERALTAGLRHRIGGNWQLGALLSYARSTDSNFDNIRKLGLSLRLEL